MAHTRVRPGACHRSTLLGFLFLFEGNARWIGALGFVLLLTGVAGNCPLYSLFGNDTCKRRIPTM
ncbi:MAG TPA: DUF2892 domain-containing protein [Steroidobacteraceae bacterium]|nr:DUF2892 domain-containing protein [Steroidobacteraceae bacterium]